MLRLLERGERDGATVISRNAERENYISFSEPIFQKRGLIYFNRKKHPNFSWESYSEPPRVYRRVKLSKDEPYDTTQTYPVLYG